MSLKNTLLIALAALLFVSVQTPLVAKNAAAVDTLIVIDPLPGGDGIGPKAPTQVPIYAYFNSMLSSVLLTFSSNLGEIEIEVMNTTTGGYDSGVVDSQFLSAVIPITGGSGHYLITFTLPSGRKYGGEFDV